jgi:hypothetical protein
VKVAGKDAPVTTAAAAGMQMDAADPAVASAEAVAAATAAPAHMICTYVYPAAMHLHHNTSVCCTCHLRQALPATAQEQQPDSSYTVHEAAATVVFSLLFDANPARSGPKPPKYYKKKSYGEQEDTVARPWDA